MLCRRFTELKVVPIVSLLSWPEQQPQLTDGRVTLRAWQPSDAPAVFKACQDDQIQRWTTVPSPYLREHAEGFVADLAPRMWTTRGGAGFAVVDPVSGDLLGACGLIGVEAERLSTGAGYWVAPWARGQHVARRALRLVTEWALGPGRLRCVELQIEPDNPASRAVGLAAGFVVSEAPPIHHVLKGVTREFVIYVQSR
jgi:RimJ/RimL family protein N-acetyltransferase